MSITTKDLIDLAKNKVKSTTSEVDIRCVVGRAYYAAYHHANNFHDSLLSPGVTPPNATGVHARLIHQLINPSIPHTDPDNLKSRSIGYILKGIHHLRKKSDYDIDDSITLNDASVAIADAERVLSK